MSAWFSKEPALCKSWLVDLAVLEEVLRHFALGAWPSPGDNMDMTFLGGPKAGSVFQHASILASLGLEWSVTVSASVPFAFLPWVEPEPPDEKEDL